MLSDPLEEGGLSSAHPQAQRAAVSVAALDVPGALLHALEGICENRFGTRGWHGARFPRRPQCLAEVEGHLPEILAASIPSPSSCPNHDPQGSPGPGRAPQSGVSASLQPCPSHSLECCGLIRVLEAGVGALGPRRTCPQAGKGGMPRIGARVTQV